MLEGEETHTFGGITVVHSSTQIDGFTVKETQEWAQRER